MTIFKVLKWEVQISRSHSIQWVTQREREERGPTRVKAKPWANTELLNDSLFSRVQGILGTAMSVLHLLQVYSLFSTKAQGSFWTPEQALSLDSRAEDLALLAKPW